MSQSTLDQALDALCEARHGDFDGDDREGDATRSSNAFSLYDQEYRTMQHAEQMVQMLEVVSRGVQDLASSYRDGLRAQQRLIRISDRLQSNLQTANRALRNKTAELIRLNQSLEREIEERLRLSRELERVAREDMLTGLMGRRAILERAEQLLCGISHEGEQGQAMASDCEGHLEELDLIDQDTPPIHDAQRGMYLHNRRFVALAVMDIDHFKKINDTLGHAGGDEALVVFANTVRRVLEPGEAFGRLGGEEFLLLMPVPSIAQATARVEAINLAVRLMAFEWEGRSHRMTASIGVTVARVSESPDIDACIRSADEALYEAKNGGRDRIVFRAMNGSI
ncbi:MAG: GGDEF domain-containing protein [Thioalkalivibrionaceae bacterium]